MMEPIILRRHPASAVHPVSSLRDSRYGPRNDVFTSYVVRRLLDRDTTLMCLLQGGGKGRKELGSVD